MNKIDKDLMQWQQREQRFAAIFPKAILSDKAFLRVKLGEMQRLYRKHQGAPGLNERLSLSMLRSANKSLEKRLYPNRFMRYGRRLFRFAGRTLGRLFNYVSEKRALAVPRNTDATLWIDSSIKASATLQNKAPAIKRIPQRKATVVTDIKKSRGLSR